MAGVTIAVCEKRLKEPLVVLKLAAASCTVEISRQLAQDCYFRLVRYCVGAKVQSWHSIECKLKVDTPLNARFGVGTALNVRFRVGTALNAVCCIS